MKGKRTEPDSPFIEPERALVKPKMEQGERYAQELQDLCDTMLGNDKSIVTLRFGRENKDKTPYWDLKIQRKIHSSFYENSNDKNQPPPFWACRTEQRQFYKQFDNDSFYLLCIQLIFVSNNYIDMYRYYQTMEAVKGIRLIGSSEQIENFITQFRKLKDRHLFAEQQKNNNTNDQMNIT